MRTDFWTTASATALIAALLPACWAGAAHAQAASAPAATPAPESSQEVVVTGSRVVRNGFQAPTPMTVLGADAIQAAAVVELADAINELPSFQGSNTSRSANVSGSVGLVGVNTLNLRGLGVNRTLVLMDGQRGAGSDSTGALDINVIPSGLVKRVDVVTGGASAAYGSDAVAGVVNFVLDHNFTGVKLNAEGGLTTYGDDGDYKGTVTVGVPFLGGRAHFLGYGEYFHIDGIELRDRPWEHSGYQVINNPAYGTTAGLSTSVPQLLMRNAVGLADAAPGGLLTTGPLQGTYFGPGGSVNQLNFGTLVPGGQMIGGDWKLTDIVDKTNEDVEQTAERFFTRVAYDLTDNINVYAGAQYARTDAFNTHGSRQYYRGTALTIFANNPFLPASVRAAALAAGATPTTTYGFGTTNADIGNPQPETIRTFTRYNIGADGNFALLGKTWKFSAHFQNSQEEVQNRVFNDIIKPNLVLALDAVVNPANGQIVCRSTLTNPTNGCLPINLFGTGVASPAAIAYSTGTANGAQFINQTSAEASVSGEPFSTWAGPVSLATGVDWRRDAAGGSSSALDQQRVFFFGNFAINHDSSSVKEFFAETAVPLAKDYAWAQSLDLNAAVRATSYSLAGNVTTWKVGATYRPISDLLLRVTRSRDIRAPSLGEITSAAQSTSGGVTDPLRKNEFDSVFTLTTGNPNLKPEISDSLGYGAVVSPRFIPRLTMSADYFDIHVTNAITTIGGQNAINLCSDGERPDLCQFIVRGAANNGFSVGPITSVLAEPVNIAALLTRGIDLEASYSVPLNTFLAGWEGTISLRGLATNTLQYTNINFDGSKNQSAGSITAPSWKFQANIALELPKDRIQFTWRGISRSTFSGDYRACTSGCPVATALNPTIDYNTVAASNLFDLSLSHRMRVSGADTEVYFIVENLFNTPPPAIPGALSGGFFSQLSTPSNYDRIGRDFHLGARLAF